MPLSFFSLIDFLHYDTPIKSLKMRRVAVTGLGIISPTGTGLEKSWNAIKEGKSGISTISRFDTTDFTVKIAGEIRDFDPTDFISKKEVKKMDLFVQYALASSLMAHEMSGLEITEELSERVGVYVGAGIGGSSGYRALA